MRKYSVVFFKYFLKKRVFGGSYIITFRFWCQSLINPRNTLINKLVESTFKRKKEIRENIYFPKKSYLADPVLENNQLSKQIMIMFSEKTRDWKFY